MKNIILTMLIAAGLHGLSLANKAANDLVNLKELMSKQQNEWFAYSGEMHLELSKLLQKEMTKWSHFGQKTIKELSAAGSVSEAWFKKELNEVLSMYRQKRNEMRTFHMDHMKKAMDLAKAQDKELESFEESAGIKEPQENESAK